MHWLAFFSGINKENYEWQKLNVKKPKKTKNILIKISSSFNCFLIQSSAKFFYLRPRTDEGLLAVL